MKDFFLLVSLIFLMVGCTQDNPQWYKTKEDAIKYGLEQESSNSILLAVEEYKDETIVFFEQDQALGVASITDSEKGFSWYRDQPLTGFESDSSYSTARFESETKQGTKVPILAGKAFDHNITKIRIPGGNNEKILRITDNSRLFYSVNDLPVDSDKMIPIVE
ncbi:hypothetical protein [Bacillus suaedae]|uniref:Uncharacterized protein n=1 Tax=Halalkalibacter suaedae TaxID=2822140 RepID=A0A941AP05_9BACI|nr:hypothetical protein [Bacillus suaedae]MBP3950952.1 hypothetical protein [Bacillus suaedae]